MEQRNVPDAKRWRAGLAFCSACGANFGILLYDAACDFLLFYLLPVRYCL